MRSRSASSFSHPSFPSKEICGGVVKIVLRNEIVALEFLGHAREDAELIKSARASFIQTWLLSCSTQRFVVRICTNGEPALTKAPSSAMILVTKPETSAETGLMVFASTVPAYVRYFARHVHARKCILPVREAVPGPTRQKKRTSTGPDNKALLSTHQLPGKGEVRGKDSQSNHSRRGVATR